MNKEHSHSIPDWHKIAAAKIYATWAEQETKKVFKPVKHELNKNKMGKNSIKNPDKPGAYLCRMESAYIKMCYWSGKSWLDMWKSTLEGSIKHWIEIPSNL